MNFKTFLNGAVLFIGLGLTAYAWLNGYRVRFNVEDVAVDPEPGFGIAAEKFWSLRKIKVLKPLWVKDFNFKRKIILNPILKTHLY